MRYILILLLSFAGLYAQFLPKPVIAKSVFLHNLDVEEDYYLKDIHEKELAVKNLKSVKTAFSNFFTKSKGNFLYYENRDKSQRVKLNLFLGTDYTTNNDNTRIMYSTGFILNGKYKNLSFNSRWWGGFFKGDHDYGLSSPLINGFNKNKYNSEKNSVYYDEISASMKYTSNYGDFSINRGVLDISNHIGNSIYLNNEVTNYGYFLWQLDFLGGRLSFAHANLIADSLDANYSYEKYDDKYLVLHEYRYNPDGLFSFFVGEQIVYGGRSIEASYLLPATFWRVTEHKQMDRDNVMIYGGFNWTIYPKAVVYANFLLDELRKGEIFGDWWGNKYALQGGIGYKGLPAISGSSEIVAQFTAIRPWLYTHDTLIGKYSINNYCLGHPKGGNLISWDLRFTTKYNNRLNFESLLTYTRQGSLGNDFSQNYQSREKDTATWLEGKITDELEVKSVVTYNINRHHRLKLGYLYSDTNDDEINLSYMVIY